jgi:hypothetical protein
MSGRSRTITDSAPPLIPGQRMAAPAELSPEQAAVWVKVISRLPAGWITAENALLLKEFARHSVYADQLAADIELARASPGGDPKDVLALLRAHGFQSQRLTSLATKLRLTKLSRYTRDAEAAAIAARSASTAKKPWEDWGH